MEKNEKFQKERGIMETSTNNLTPQTLHKSPERPLETFDYSSNSNKMENSFPSNSTSTEEIDFNETWRRFLSKKIQKASSFIKKPKPHTCKVNVVTEETSLQLMISDGTFMNEGLVFLKGKLSGSKSEDKSNQLFDRDSILELSFDFELPYDINSGAMLQDVITLKNLQSLFLKTNYIQSVPLQLARIKKLHTLALPNNQIKSLGPEIGYLTGITSLDLSYNQIVSLSKDIGKLVNLKSLNLSNNYLSSLPSTFDSLSNLKILNVSFNRLTSLPHLDGLSSLEELNLESNFLTHIAPTAEGIIDKVMKNITTTNSNMQTLSKLLSLSKLNLRNNRLVSFPEVIIKMPNLRTCDLSHNNIQQVSLTLDLPFDINLLTSLDLSHNKLTSLSTEIASLIQLNASHNLLTSLGSNLTSLVALKELDVSSNSINDLSSELGRLITLEKLNLSRNLLKDDQLQTLASLKQLKFLDLCKNDLSSIPAFLTDLVNLEVLNVSKNRIRILPSKIFANLPKLEKLDISENRLVSIPYSLSLATSLSSLRIHFNKVSSFPRELCALTSLTEMSIFNLHINAKGELNVIQNQNEISDRGSIPLYSLISLIRSSPHPLLLFALSLLSEEEQFQQDIVSEGALADLIYFIQNFTGRIQLEAIKVLANLSNNDENLNFLIQEGAIDVILNTLADSKAEEASKLYALIILGNIGLRDENRLSVIHRQDLMDLLSKMAKDDKDLTLQKYCRRTLAILGCLDNSDPNRGIRILTLDGGGARGVTTVEILKYIEKVTGKRIYELFDLIGGTSAGGLTGACIGLKHFGLDRISFLQDKIAMEIFAHGISRTTSEDSLFGSNWEKLQYKFSNYATFLRHGTVYSTKSLEEQLQSLMGPEELLIDTVQETDVKFFAVSTISSLFPPQIFLWRNYVHPQTKSRYAGTITKKTWEALKATSCAPFYFDEYTNGIEKHQDGGCIANNPTAIAVHEAKCLWGNRKIDCIVSIGTGVVPTKEKQGNYVERTIVELIECASSVERVHEFMTDVYPPEMYFRFNPVDERFACELDEYRKEKLDEMRDAAREYCERNHSRFEELAKILTS